MKSSLALAVQTAAPMLRHHPYKRGERTVVEGLSGHVLEVGYRWVVLQLDGFSGEWAYNYSTQELRRYERPEWLVTHIHSIRQSIDMA